MSSDDESNTPDQTAPGSASASQEPGVSTEPTELERMKAMLAQKETEAKEHYDRYLRAAADLDNLKKRTQRERTEQLRFAEETLIRDLLPIVDNLERAVAHAQGGGNGHPLIEGVGLVLRSLLDVLERHGVTRIEARGEAFDPARHEAIAQIEIPDQEPNRVVDQHLPGYMLHDRLLRAAQVSVSARAEKREKPVANGEDDG
jgi:molecular chaperone GrpE